MPAPNWPAGLPDRLLQQGYQQGFGDGRIRSEMETGPAQVRLRSSAMPAPLSGVTRMTAAQVAILRTFVKTTLLGGSIAFYYPDPLTRTPTLARLIDLPSWTAVSGNLYDVSLNMELLP